VTTWNDSRLRVAIVAAIAAKVVGLVLLFDWSGRALNPFDLTKSVWSRALEWGLAALLLIALVSFGPAILPRTRLHLAVVAIVAVNAVSALVAPVPFVAIFGTDGRYLGLVFVLDMAVLYLAVATAFRTSWDWGILFGSVAVAVVVSLGYAWIQFAGYDPLAWTGSQLQRPFSTIGNPNTYGHLLSVSVGPAALLAVTSVGSRGWVTRALAGALALAIFATSVIVATRGTVLGVAAALIVVAALFLRSHGLTRRNVLLATAGILGSAFVVAIVIAVSPLGERLKETLAGQSIQDRLLSWQGAAQAFLARPALGWGPDSLIVAWPSVRPFDFARLVGPGIDVDSAHNWMLGAAATTGLLGLAAAVIAIVVFGISLGRALSTQGVTAAVIVAALAGYWAHALVSVGTIGVDWVPWLGFGAIAGFAAPAPGPVLRRHPSAVLVGATLVVALIGALSGLRALEANQEALRARHASDIRQGADAATHAVRAIELDGGRADYWNELGRAYGASGRWADAADAFARASARAPYSATYVANVGRALGQLALAGDNSRGGTDAALDAARRAVTIDPNEPLTHLALAQIALALDRPGIALTAAVDAIRLFPNPQNPFYDGFAAAAAAKVDTATAKRELERALGYKETARLRVALAEVALREGDKPAVLANAQRALQLDPKNPDAPALIRAAGG
jgi:O-antigen ligase/Tfp pilus assembly protein PilF